MEARKEAAVYSLVRYLKTYPLKVVFFLLAIVFIILSHQRNYEFMLSPPKKIISTGDYGVLASNAFFPTTNQTGRRVVIVSPSTFEYRETMENLQYTIQRQLGMYAIVVALDQQIANYSTTRGFPTIGPFTNSEWKGASEKQSFTFGSDSFRTVTKMKLRIVRAILADTNFDVLLTDVDIVWCRNAVAEIRTMINTGMLGDILIQGDANRDGKAIIRLNTGFYYAKNKRDVIQLFDETIEFASRAENDHYDDQRSFVLTACNGDRGSETNRMPKEIVGKGITICDWRGKVRIRALPVAQFVNGGALINNVKVKGMEAGELRGLCDNRNISIWHNNWVKSKLKMSMFKHHNMWFLQK